MAYLTSLVAYIFYGGWALWVNVGAGNQNPVFPALFHGLYAALITWSIHKLVTWVYWRANQFACHPGFTAWLTATTISFTLPFFIQFVTGGASPLVTMAPGLLIGQLYIAGLLYDLTKVKSTRLTYFSDTSRYD